MSHVVKCTRLYLLLHGIRAYLLWCDTVSRTELNLLFKKQFASTMKSSGMVSKDDFMTGMEAVGIGAAG